MSWGGLRRLRRLRWWRACQAIALTLPALAPGGHALAADVPAPALPVLDSGPYGACLADGAGVRCWGNGGSGIRQIAGLAVPDGTPQTAITSVSARIADGCAVQGGRVLCWGSESLAPAGATPTTAVAVPGLDGVVRVSVDGEQPYACALKSNRTVACWGRNAYGQVGNGASTAQPTPVVVPGMDDVTAMDTGARHACVIRAGGRVWCWGNNNLSQLGHATADSTIHLPEEVGVPDQRITDATAIAAGVQSTCVLRGAAGTVSCWGYTNSSGVLGGSTSAARPIATINGITGATQITAGLAFHCAVDGSQATRCWGINQVGQLGDATTLWRYTPTVTVPVAPVPSQLSSGYQHTCGITGLHVSCWGNKLGLTVGDPLVKYSSLPFTVPGLEVVAPAAPPSFDGVIDTAGPLTRLATTSDLRCGRTVAYQLLPLFADDTRGCGTWVAAGGTVYGPAPQNMGRGWPASTTPVAPLSQTERGTGTAADPYEIETRAYAGDLLITQRDRYVNGESRTTTDISVKNTGRSDRGVSVFNAGDCVHADERYSETWSHGYGFQTPDDRTLGRVRCTETNQGGRTISWQPDYVIPATTTGTIGPVVSNAATVGTLATISARIAAGGSLGGPCDCARLVQNAGGISWALRLHPGEMSTVSFELHFSGESAPPQPEPADETVDVDGDGLPDAWERPGARTDTNGDGRAELDLAAMGAGADMPDLFVQIAKTQARCRYFEDCRGGWKTIAPTVTAIRKVQRQFLKHGIRLHVDGGPTFVMNPVTGEQWGRRSAIGPPVRYSDAVAPVLLADAQGNRTLAAGLGALSAGSFPHPDRATVFRNFVWVHAIVEDNGKEAGGIADRPGMWGAVAPYACTAGVSCTRGTTLDEATGFMHELGHNLGLEHGGADAAEYKPNYPSVMNYAYSFGVPFQRNGTARYTDDSVNYSSGAFDPLDESALWEAEPLTPSAVARRFMIRWVCPNRTLVGPVPAGDEHDWNCDGQISQDQSVAVNVDAFNGIGTVTDHDDWAAIALPLPKQDGPVPLRGEPVLQPRPVVTIAGEDTLVLSVGEQRELAYTVRNPHADERTYRLSAVVAGLALRGLPESVTVPARGEVTIPVTITVESPAAGLEIVASWDTEDISDESAFATRIVAPETPAAITDAGAVVLAPGGGAGTVSAPVQGCSRPAGTLRSTLSRSRLRLARVPGTGSRRARTITLSRNCKLIARGTLRGRTVTLRRPKAMPRLRGSYDLRWAGGGVRLTVR